MLETWFGPKPPLDSLFEAVPNPISEVSIFNNAMLAILMTGPRTAKNKRWSCTVESFKCEKNQAENISASGPDMLKLIIIRAVWISSFLDDQTSPKRTIKTEGTSSTK